MLALADEKREYRKFTTKMTTYIVKTLLPQRASFGTSVEEEDEVEDQVRDERGKEDEY